MKALYLKSPHKKGNKFHSTCKEHFETTTVTNVKEFKRKLKQLKPDIVIVPPTKDGVNAVKAIPNTPMAPQVSMDGASPKMLSLARKFYQDTQRIKT